MRTLCGLANVLLGLYDWISDGAGDELCHINCETDWIRSRALSTQYGSMVLHSYKLVRQVGFAQNEVLQSNSLGQILSCGVLLYTVVLGCAQQSLRQRIPEPP
eukprot:6228345-Amphidinium_carterae.1